MLSHALLRTTSRRIISGASTQGKRAASSQAFRRSEQEARKLLPLAAAATVGAVGLLTANNSRENETKNAQCLFGKGKKETDVEEKFATYWPRNIMILFGPPGLRIISNMNPLCSNLC